MSIKSISHLNLGTIAQVYEDFLYLKVITIKIGTIQKPSCNSLGLFGFIQHFSKDLRDHILAQVKGLPTIGIDHRFSNAERIQVAIKNDTIRWHQTIRINYTTYDVRREQCLINPKQQGDVMMYSNSPDDILPYCFARVEGIMKVNVVYTGTQPPLEQEIPVLWVRWYELCNEEELGWDT